jgi:hypothetical protein
MVAARYRSCPTHYQVRYPTIRVTLTPQPNEITVQPKNSRRSRLEVLALLRVRRDPPDRPGVDTLRMKVVYELCGECPSGGDVQCDVKVGRREVEQLHGISE